MLFMKGLRIVFKSKKGLIKRLEVVLNYFLKV